ncbi:ATP-binding protein [Sporosarcina sp. ACRSM]|uniref:ATP-binding protein n=1 Tax=Sporosarcina sp. ACRSM TaxID=2918216 RepID=UPI001EF6C785|nr:ATP-binding protein [Sporosarcina sp. ACRSM]MCG7335453.1 ATP-binding protein [Sporosarcina sp. ACRSM]
MNTYEIEHLAEQQMLIEDITNNLEVGICQYDAKENKFLYLSPAMEGLLGIPVADVLRDHRMFVANCHAEDVADLARFYKGAFKEQTDVEYRILDTADEVRWLRTTITPILDEAGNVLRYISITQDITNQKLHDELLQKWDKLNVVGQLAASLAHQIRNPLTTIKGFIQLLELKNDKSFKAIMTEEVETIESIIEEFLQLAKPSSSTEFSIALVQNKIKRTVSLLEKEAMLRNIEIRVFPNGEDAFIRCESKQIQQVFMNIIKNSIEAMPTGGIIEIRTVVEADNMVKITIADTGSGMSMERLQKLGEPFYSQKEKGTGLGLMVSYKIIESHNGTIQFASQEGVGTTVEIRLPIVLSS